MDFTNTICVLPWVHVASTSGGTARVCCNGLPEANLIHDASGNAIHLSKTSDLSQIVNSERLKAIRREMLAGQRPKTCERCFREEDAGLHSSRMGSNDYYHDQVPFLKELTLADGTIGPKVRYLDLRLGNLCNLKCRMCNPFSSRKWLEDWEKVNPGKLTKDDHSFLKQGDWFESESFWNLMEKSIHTVDQIYLTGGEPMLIRGQIRFLEECIRQGRAKHILLKYNTNATYLPTDLASIWEQFREVHINCSIDGIGRVNDYIRFPSVWQDIESNLQALDDMMTRMGGLSVSIHTTVQAYNGLHLVELLDYFKDNYSRITPIPFFNILNHPSHLNIRVLPVEMKAAIAEGLTKWLAENQDDPRLYRAHATARFKSRFSKISAISTYLQEDWSHLFDKFADFTKQLDQIRNQDIGEILPQLRISP